MAQSARSRAAFISILTILIALHLVLIATTRLFPFIDLPNHLAAATIHRHLNEPGTNFAAYYLPDLFPKPNVFHALFCSIPLFPSVESANRAFLALYAVLLPLSLLLVIARLGGNRWFSLLSFPLLYNYNLSWGFVGFAFSIPIVFFFLYLLIEHLRDGSIWYRYVASILMVFLFFVHALAAIFASVLLLACIFLAGRRSFSWAAQRCAMILPVLTMLIAWWKVEASHYGGQGTARFLGTYYRQEYFTTFVDRRSIFFLDNNHLFEGSNGYLIGLAFSLCIILPVLVLLILRRRPCNHWGSVEGRFSLALLIPALACFIILPNQIPRQAILYQRFSVLVLLSVIVLGSTLMRRPLRMPAAAGIVAACLLHFLLWAGYFIDFNRENAGFRSSFLPDGRRGGVLAGLVYDYRFRGKPVYIHFPSYYIIWQRGVASTKIVDYRFGIIRRKVGHRELPLYEEWIGVLPEYDGRYENVDFLLVRGDPTPGHTEDLAGFTPLRAEDAWTLYKRMK
ncbi:MAG: hypothetical protein JSV33_07285 [bacterium]|nr:MAG: hypothetical protein JSV33_07285 [bacterium]